MAQAASEVACKDEEGNEIECPEEPDEEPEEVAASVGLEEISDQKT